MTYELGVWKMCMASALKACLLVYTVQYIVRHRRCEFIFSFSIFLQIVCTCACTVHTSVFHFKGFKFKGVKAKHISSSKESVCEWECVGREMKCWVFIKKKRDLFIIYCIYVHVCTVQYSTVNAFIVTVIVSNSASKWSDLIWSILKDMTDT